MKNYFSLQSQDCIYSADGKCFSLKEILNDIRIMIAGYARKRGRSMKEAHLADLFSIMEEKVAVEFSAKYSTSQGPLKPWLSRIVTNEGNDLLRRIIREQEALKASEKQKVKRYDADADDELNYGELKSRWERFLATLEGEKRIIMQWSSEGMKPREIAEELGIPAEKVHRTLCRERNRFAELIGYHRK